MRKVLIILFILISNICKAQTISIDNSNLSIEIPNIEISYDYKDVDIYIYLKEFLIIIIYHLYLELVTTLLIIYMLRQV